MKKFLVFLFVTFFASAAHADFEKITTITDPVDGPFRQADALDANVSLQFGDYQGVHTSNLQMRVGYLALREPVMYSLSPIVQFSTKMPTVYGLEFEINHFWSGWRGQFGVLSNASFILGGGFSIFGVEAQARVTEGTGPLFELSIFGKIDVPVGVLVLWMAN
jgi:hypothetical protein